MFNPLVVSHMKAPQSGQDQRLFPSGLSRGLRQIGHRLIQFPVIVKPRRQLPKDKARRQIRTIPTELVRIRADNRIRRPGRVICLTHESPDQAELDHQDPDSLQDPAPVETANNNRLRDP